MKRTTLLSHAIRDAASWETCARISTLGRHGWETTTSRANRWWLRPREKGGNAHVHGTLGACQKSSRSGGWRSWPGHLSAVQKCSRAHQSANDIAPQQTLAVGRTIPKESRVAPHQSIAPKAASPTAPADAPTASKLASCRPRVVPCSPASFLCSLA